MPLYHYSCPRCQAELDDIRPMNRPERKCPDCGAFMLRPVQKNSPGGPQGNIFRHVFLENAATNGMTFSSKSDLKKWCRKEGLAVSQLHT